MKELHTLLFYFHVLVGSMALFLFWIPVLSRKGSLDHRKFGRYYANVMYCVAGSGGGMALLVLAGPMLIKGHLLNNPGNEAAFVSTVQIFWSFLLYLSLLSFTSTRHGLAVLNHRDNVNHFRQPGYYIPLVVLVLGGVAIFALGLAHQRILHMVFGVLGVAIGVGTLRYCMTVSATRNPWASEHLSALIGSGIGAYTAFLAFGGRQLLSDYGDYQLVFWIAPGVIGSIAIGVLSRKYGPKLDIREELDHKATSQH